MSNLKPYQLPPLPPKDTDVGNLARQLLTGDLTALLPLRDALLDAGRERDARKLYDYIVGFIDRTSQTTTLSPWTVSAEWDSLCRTVFRQLMGDLFDDASVLTRYCELMSNPNTETGVDDEEDEEDAWDDDMDDIDPVELIEDDSLVAELRYRGYNVQKSAETASPR